MKRLIVIKIILIIKNSTVLIKLNSDIDIIMRIQSNSMKLPKILNHLISVTIINKIINFNNIDSLRVNQIPAVTGKSISINCTAKTINSPHLLTAFPQIPYFRTQILIGSTNIVIIDIESG